MDAYAVTVAGEGRYVGVATLGTTLTEQQAAQPRGPAATRPWPPTPTSRARSRPNATTGCSPHTASTPNSRGSPWGWTRPTPTHRGPDALLAALGAAVPLGRMLLNERVTNMDPPAALLEAVQVLAARRPEAWQNELQQLGERLYVGEAYRRAVPARRRPDLGRGPAAGGRGEGCCHRGSTGAPRSRGQPDARAAVGSTRRQTRYTAGRRAGLGQPRPRCCSRPTKLATTSRPRPAPW